MMPLMKGNYCVNWIFVQKRQKKCYSDLNFGLESVVSKDIEDLKQGFGIEGNN